MIAATRRHRIIVVIVLVLALAALSLAVSANARQWLRAYVEEQRLKYEVRAIKVPPGASLVGTYSLDGAPNVTAVFHYKGDFANVIHHYQRELSNQGFKQIPQTSGDDTGFFCRPGRSVLLNPIEHGYGMLMGKYLGPC
jgi:hypothetical protein